MEKRGTVVPLWNFQTKTLKLPFCIDVCATFSGARLRRWLAVARGEVCGSAKTSPRAIVQPFIHTMYFDIMEQHSGTFSGYFCGLLDSRHVCGLLLRAAFAGCFCGLLLRVAFAGCFCGLLLRAAYFAAVMVPPSLSSVRATRGRTFVQEAMAFWLRVRIHYLSPR